jgi:DNA replication and repair protein RecF
VSESAQGPLTESDADMVEEQLREALARKRRAEIDRGLTLVGPHRDELQLLIDGLDARHQASQGEQRTLALALRLAGHMVVRDLAGAAPVLLLDDVFSELDANRAAALVRNLPPGQTLLTTAGALPPGIEAQQTLVVHAGRVEAVRPS